MVLLSGGICGLLVLALLPLQSRADEDEGIKKICEENLCSSTEGCPLAKNTLLTTLPVLNKEFKVSFEFRATAWQSGWQNVIHFTEGGNWGYVGARIPAFWVSNSGRLHPCSALGDNGNYCTLTTKEYSVNTWHSVEISQTLKNGKYMYRVVVDGEDVIASAENTKPRAFLDVKVFAADNWYTPLKGSIRNLLVNRGCGGPEIFKNDYLALKSDGSKEYKKEVLTRLPRLLEKGILKEGEVGLAFEVTNPKEKYPLGLLTGDGINTNKIPKQSIAINGTVNQFILKRSYGSARFRPTGLYAAPGDIITVTIPEEMVNKISVDLGQDAHSIRFKMKKTTQKVGSPWGGLILIFLDDTTATTNQGQFNVEIQNGVQAPYFVYGEDTNEKWNKIKNNASPWAVLRIPGQLQVYILTVQVKSETDMEKVMKGWKETMDLLDDMMGIPVGIQPGEERLHWHPYVGGGLRWGVCIGGARSDIGYYDYSHFLRDNCAVTYHEFGHGYCYSDLPGGDNPREGMGGQWTAEIIREYVERTKPGLPPISSRESKFGDPFNVLYRMVSFKKFSKGKPCGEVKFQNKKSSYWTDSYDNCWAYLYRLPLWEWGWNKLREVLRADAPLTKHYETKPDRLADIYCNVTKHNLIPLFKFYNIEISDSIVKSCEKLKEPSLITDYINIANCIMTEDINDCIDLPGFPSYEGICTINGVCKSSPDHEGKQRTMKNEFDLWGGTIDKRYKPGTRSTAYNEKNCLKRAAEVHKWCGNDQSQLVTATFTPKDGTPKSATNIPKGNCYYDNPRLLPEYIGPRSNMVPEVCNSMCREAEDPDTLEKYSYFGVQYRDECWCGHKAPPLSRKLDPEDCDTMCKGDEKLRCGGGWKANIWKVCTDENCEFKYD